MPIPRPSMRSGLIPAVVLHQPPGLFRSMCRRSRVKPSLLMGRSSGPWGLSPIPAAPNNESLSTCPTQWLVSCFTP